MTLRTEKNPGIETLKDLVKALIAEAGQTYRTCHEKLGKDTEAALRNAIAENRISVQMLFGAMELNGITETQLLHELARLAGLAAPDRAP